MFLSSGDRYVWEHLELHQVCQTVSIDSKHNGTFDSLTPEEKAADPYVN